MNDDSKLDDAERLGKLEEMPKPQIVRFHENWNEISSMLDARYSIRHVWRVMVAQGKTTYCYQQFRIQVALHLPDDGKHKKAQRTEPTAVTESRLVERRPKGSAVPTSTMTKPKFVFNRNLNEKDLI